MKIKSKTTILLFIILTLFTMILVTPSSQVFAYSKPIEIKLLGSSYIEVQADSAEIFGSIECVDMSQEKADELVKQQISWLKQILSKFDNLPIDITYQNTYPIDPACYRSMPYMGFVNFQIKVQDLSILSQDCSNISQINNIRVDGINYYTQDSSAYITALKQAIAKANSKISSLYTTEVNILEIEEIDCYNSSSTYISQPNIDFNEIPTIEISAKVEITYLIP